MYPIAPVLFQLGWEGRYPFWPIRWFWPLIRDTARRGELLFKTLNGRGINRVFGAIFLKIGPPAAERYSAHVFRRWGAQELKETCSQCPAIASSGDWHSSDFRWYVAFSDAMAADMAKLAISDYASESGD